MYEEKPSQLYEKNVNNLQLNANQERILQDILFRLRSKGHLAPGEYRSHKLNITKKLDDKYHRERIFDCHVGGNNKIVLLYDFDADAKEVYLLNIGSHKDVGLESVCYASEDQADYWQCLNECYSDDTFPSIVAVEPLLNYTMFLRFSNGEIRYIDFRPIIKDDTSKRCLANRGLFLDVQLLNNDKFSGIYWDTDFCISFNAQRLYRDSIHYKYLKVRYGFSSMF